MEESGEHNSTTQIIKADPDAPRSRGTGRKRGRGRSRRPGYYNSKQQSSQVSDKCERKQSEKAGDAHDYVRLVPLPKYREQQQQQIGYLSAPPSEWFPVSMSEIDKATPMKLDADKMSVTSWKGYRIARSTHGSHFGTWFYEVIIQSLGDTGHCRIGWATKKAELQAPVGYDKYGYSYRDVDGSKYNLAWRHEYGEPYKEGDVIGCLIHLPKGGLTLEKGKQDIVRWKSQYCIAIEDDLEPEQLKGSFVAFYKNGVFQGKAFEDILEGTYYAAVSIFTLPEQTDGATLRVGFGPQFQHPPSDIEGLPEARPLCELAGEPPQRNDVEEMDQITKDAQ
eukprot:TRINITY_DN14307_c0_g1_i1.p1 TRINITY_DN14307_c0_g1~~TRINITY_DN14307_c0_g1_i1.p1  ORF type:complete len:386 (+),score=51.10 TRINITY_DN14307_c0_g1_i1:152-1159(+)